MNDTWKYILQMKVRVDRIYSFAVRYCVSKYMTLLLQNWIIDLWFWLSATIEQQGKCIMLVTSAMFIVNGALTYATCVEKHSRDRMHWNSTSICWTFTKYLNVILVISNLFTKSLLHSKPEKDGSFPFQCLIKSCLKKCHSRAHLKGKV
jgi:hypothetical protein